MGSWPRGWNPRPLRVSPPSLLGATASIGGALPWHPSLRLHEQRRPSFPRRGVMRETLSLGRYSCQIWLHQKPRWRDSLWRLRTRPLLHKRVQEISSVAPWGPRTRPFNHTEAGDRLSVSFVN